MNKSELRHLIREEIKSAMQKHANHASINLTVLFSMGPDVDEERFNDWMDEVIEKGLVDVSFRTAPSQEDVNILNVTIDSTQMDG